MHTSTNEYSRRSEFAGLMLPRAWKAFWRTLLWQAERAHAVLLLLLLIGGVAGTILAIVHHTTTLGVVGNVLLGLILLWALFTGAFEAWLESQRAMATEVAAAGAEGKAVASAVSQTQQSLMEQRDDLAFRLGQAQDEAQLERERHSGQVREIEAECQRRLTTPARRSWKLKGDLLRLASESLAMHDLGSEPRPAPPNANMEGVIDAYHRAVALVKAQAPGHEAAFSYAILQGNGPNDQGNATRTSRFELSEYLQRRGTLAWSQNPFGPWRYLGEGIKCWVSRDLSESMFDDSPTAET